jgi:glycosyltransferase involved in cell wall biosynthesis
VRRVHVVIPEGVDDVERRSGGNVYDRRVCDGLRARGWDVREVEVPGGWPSPAASARRALASRLAALDDGELVVVDGLLTAGAHEVLVSQTPRLAVVVLVHLPLGLGGEADDGPERAVLSAAAAVVTTSAWTRRWLLEAYVLNERRVHVAEPGVDPGDLAPGSTTGLELLCVAAVTPHKGQDVLLAALARLRDVPWRCRCVGSTERDPAFSSALARVARSRGLAERFVLTGNRSGPGVDHAYARSVVLVLPSRVETYGLVVTEALARGLPVIASEVGGVPEALGTDSRGARPGLLVPPDDEHALAGALRSWVEDAHLRSRLRRSASERRSTLRRWATTAETFARVLDGVASCVGR